MEILRIKIFKNIKLNKDLISILNRNYIKPKNISKILTEEKFDISNNVYRHVFLNK